MNTYWKICLISNKLLTWVFLLHWYLVQRKSNKDKCDDTVQKINHYKRQNRRPVSFHVDNFTKIPLRINDHLCVLYLINHPAVLQCLGHKYLGHSIALIILNQLHRISTHTYTYINIQDSTVYVYWFCSSATTQSNLKLLGTSKIQRLLK